MIPQANVNEAGVFTPRERLDAKHGVDRLDVKWFLKVNQPVGTFEWYDLLDERDEDMVNGKYLTDTCLLFKINTRIKPRIWSSIVQDGKPFGAARAQKALYDMYWDPKAVLRMVKEGLHIPDGEGLPTFRLPNKYREVTERTNDVAPEVIQVLRDSVGILDSFQSGAALGTDPQRRAAYERRVERGEGRGTRIRDALATPDDTPPHTPVRAPIPLRLLGFGGLSPRQEEPDHPP